MSDDKVKLLADAIRLELLAELRAAKGEMAVLSIRERADVLNRLDNRDFGATLLSAPAMAEQAPEPNREFVRACLRFQDDGRDWSGEILLETSDGEVKRAVCAGLGGETALIRLDGVERMTEFSRFTGECIDAAYTGKLHIASSELYRVHPETYRIRRQAAVEFVQQRAALAAKNAAPAILADAEDIFRRYQAPRAPSPDATATATATTETATEETTTPPTEGSVG